jgi:esterase/lipase
MTSPVQLNSFIYLKNSDYQYLAEFDRGITRRYNWPKLDSSPEKKVKLQILRLEQETGDARKALCSGDRVRLKTSEPRAGNKDTLGQFYDSRNCYYWTDNYDPRRQGWMVEKVNGNPGDPIYYDDPITLTNLYFAGQKLGADTKSRWDGYIHIDKAVADTWVLEKAEPRPLEEYEWQEYYQKFTYFFPDAIRPGCYPRKFKHADPSVKQAIVLVHGLTDSPYFMTAIAQYFFNTLKYNVYLPLLEGHGLVIPSGMEGVSHKEWQRNVQFAVETAYKDGASQVSIGGLSTGGTLSCYEAMTNSNIHSLYLFSAALDIAGSAGIGEVKEVLLRTFMADVLEFDYLPSDPLIGKNPYRYSRMDLDGARELSEQIKLVDEKMATYSPQKSFAVPVFAAHSECDTAADIEGIENLRRVCDLDQFRFFRIPKEIEVSHASLVLKTPVTTDAEEPPRTTYYRVMLAIFDWLDARLRGLRSFFLPAEPKTKRVEDLVLEEPNPVFDTMMEAIARFESSLVADADQQEALQLQELRDRLKWQDFLDEEKPQQTAGSEPADASDAADSIVRFHQHIIATPTALSGYATLAQMVYRLQSSADAKLPDAALSQISAMDGYMIDGTVLTMADSTLEVPVMGVEYAQNGTKDLIVVYGGTDSQNRENLVDAATAIRALIQEAMAQGTSLSSRGDKGAQFTKLLEESTSWFNQLIANHRTLDSYDNVTVVGHSIGGLVAAYVACEISKIYQDDPSKTIGCHTFNAVPGAKYILHNANQDTTEVPDDRAIARYIINHRIVGDRVSVLSADNKNDEMNSEGFPYGHLGYLYHWRSLEPETQETDSRHHLKHFIDDFNFETRHLLGISPAPIGKVYE